MFGLLVPPTSKFASNSLTQASVIIIFANIHSHIVICSEQYLSAFAISKRQGGGGKVLKMSHKRHGREEGASIDEKRFRKSHSFRR